MDSYILTPLAEMEDSETTEMDSTVDETAESTVIADDYVQSLVTIESNWANGKEKKMYDRAGFYCFECLNAW